MRLNQLRQTMIDFLPNFIGHHRFEWRLGNFDRQIQFPAMADVDDRTVGIAGLVHGAGANEKTRNFFDRLLRRGQTDSLERLFCERG